MTIKNPSSPQLRELLFAFLQRVSFFEQIEPCSACNSDKINICIIAIRIVSNMILNNFCKLVTDTEKVIGPSKPKKPKNQKQINITGKK